MIVLYNPHVDDFLGAPAHFMLVRRRPLKKYGFVLNRLLRSEEKVAVCVDASLSGLLPASVFCRLPKFLRTAISEVEFRIWSHLNGIHGENVLRIDSAVARSSDVLLAFSYKAAGVGFALRKPLLEGFGAVVFHLSHYFISTSEKASNIKALPNAYLAGDSDIRGNVYFRKFFAWYDRPFLVLPFAVAARFRSTKPIERRRPCAVATGSMHNLDREYPADKYADFMSESGLDTYHPTRKLIYSHRVELEGVVQCHVSYYRNYEQPALMKVLGHLRVSQKKYFSTDLVELYNHHQMAIVGEEFSGFPALGAFEAMACGALLLAKADAYEGLGVAPNVHFLEHDGTLSSIRAAVARGRLPESLPIAEKGREFATKYFSEAAAADAWMGILRSLEARLPSV